MRGYDRVSWSGTGQDATSSCRHCPNGRFADEETDAEDNEVRVPGCVAETEE